LSTLSSLGNARPSPLTVRTLQALYASQTPIRLVWVPSHSGIPGNERADSLAKSAITDNATRISLKTSKLRTKKKVIEKQLQEWDEQWKSTVIHLSKHTKWIQSIFPHRGCFVKLSRLKRWTPELAQIFTGHNSLGYFEGRKRKEIRLCEFCHKSAETTDHFLFFCAKWKKLRTNWNYTNRFSFLTNNPHRVKTFLKYTNRLKRSFNR